MAHTGIHCGNLEATIESYNLMSCGWFTHASPTLFNAGTPRPQLSSCFLLTMKDDSIEGIYDTLKVCPWRHCFLRARSADSAVTDSAVTEFVCVSQQCAMISKQAGGIGLACHNIRATGRFAGCFSIARPPKSLCVLSSFDSYIRGTNGTSNGLVPMLRVFNNTARYVDQGAFGVCLPSSAVPKESGSTLCSFVCCVVPFV